MTEEMKVEITINKTNLMFLLCKQDGCPVEFTEWVFRISGYSFVEGSQGLI